MEIDGGDRSVDVAPSIELCSPPPPTVEQTSTDNVIFSHMKFNSAEYFALLKKLIEKKYLFLYKITSSEMSAWGGVRDIFLKGHIRTGDGWFGSANASSVPCSSTCHLTLHSGKILL